MKEIDRNEEVWELQGNRNPFVDYPGLEKLNLKRKGG